MDDQRLGALLRVLRRKRGLRQVDVAALAGVSDCTVSRAERGHIESLSVSAIRRLARVLEARLDLHLWTRAGEVERIASGAHAEVVNSLIATLVGFGWTAQPEVSFNHRGERGLVDIVAWHGPTRSLLLIEVKTEIVDVGELFGTFDRKRRLAPEIARQLGLDPLTISTALVVADTRTNHRRIAMHAATFGAVLPHGGQRFRSFVRQPVGAIVSLSFWPYRHPGTARQSACGPRRVRKPRPSTINAVPNVGRDASAVPGRVPDSRAPDPDA
jgi:transcriptional regulator with XRE-family HTH domain